MKFCKDCKHHTLVNPGWLYDLVDCCTHNVEYDPVSGTPLPKICAKLRKSSGKCGPGAARFEPK